ncbi:MAG: hypothetical protein GF311_22725 [Candidatus Lokiarchaeota archaeon]|jgi:hypothetical protein|nr:hypothetical protein [Candidatus Lokiarchaeota archaeon]
MADWERYKWPVISIIIIFGVLSIMLSVGFTVGILSGDPDGLERVLEDSGVGEPESFWTPFLSFITNEYVAGLLGLLLAAIIIGGVFYLITYFKNKRAD